MPAHFLAMLPNFIAYFLVAAMLMTFYLLIYLNATPYKELALIRSGNVAASISLSGTLIGFALPIANVIAHSDTVFDLAMWGVVAGIVQLLAYYVTRVLLPTLNEDIPEGRIAPATLFATLSLAVGIINAACMTY